MGRPSRIHRHGGGWRFRYRGSQYWRATYTDIVTLFSEVVGAAGLPDAPLTLGEVIPHWQTLHPSVFHSQIVRPLEDWGGGEFLRRIDDAFLGRYRAELDRRGYSPASIRKMIFAAAAVLKLAIKRGWLQAMPAVPRCPSPPPRPKGLSAGQLGELLATLEARPTTDHLVPLIRFAADTGMRPGEVCRLRWDDVDLARGAIVLTEHKTARRTEAARIVILPPAALALLEGREREGVYVFTNRSGRPYSRDGLAATLRRYGVTPNQLRHTFAQSMIDVGIRPEMVTEMLGHRTSRMVWQYASIRAELVRAELALVETPSQRADAAQTQPRTSPPARARAKIRAGARSRRKG